MEQTPPSRRAVDAGASSSKAPRSPATTSESMCRLVRSRDQVFELQRACTDDTRMTASRAAMDVYLDKLAKREPKSTCPSAWRNYSRFCDAQQVPLFPVLSPMIALWLYDKNSTSHEWSRTYQNYIERCARVVNGIWAGEPSFEAVKRLDSTGRAVREFMLERKELHLLDRSSRLSTSAPSSSTAEPASARDTIEASSSRIRASLRPRAGPVAALRRAASSRTIRWKLRHDRSIAAQQSERDSDEEDEAEVVIPKKKRLCRGGRPLSSSSDQDSASVDSAQGKAKRVRLELSASAVDANPAPRIPLRRRIIISPSESSESEADGDERTLSARSSAPSPSTAPVLLDPSKRSTSPELQQPSKSPRAAMGFKPLVVEPLERPKLEEGEDGVRARPEGAVGRSAAHTSIASTSTAERHSSLLPTTSIELPNLSSSLPPLLPPTFGTDSRSTASGVRVGRALKLEAASPPPAGTASAGRSASTLSAAAVPSALQDVEAFLIGLHRSLAPLAQPLVHAGFNSVAALSSLVLLEPAILELSLGLHRDKAGRRTKVQCRSVEPFADVSVIHLTLLARRLREEGEGLRS